MHKIKKLLGILIFFMKCMCSDETKYLKAMFEKTLAGKTIKYKIQLFDNNCFAKKRKIG